MDEFLFLMGFLLVAVLAWILLLFVGFAVVRSFLKSRQKKQAPRTRCAGCGEIYFGEICPMCGKRF